MDCSASPKSLSSTARTWSADTVLTALPNSLHPQAASGPHGSQKVPALHGLFSAGSQKARKQGSGNKVDQG